MRFTKVLMVLCLSVVLFTGQMNLSQAFTFDSDDSQFLGEEAVQNQSQSESVICKRGIKIPLAVLSFFTLGFFGPFITKNIISYCEPHELKPQN